MLPISQKARMLLTMRELADTYEEAQSAGRKIAATIVLRALERELYRFHWYYHAADSLDFDRYLELTGLLEPEDQEEKDLTGWIEAPRFFG